MIALYEFPSCFVFSPSLSHFPTAIPLYSTGTFFNVLIYVFGYIKILIKYNIIELLYVCGLALYTWHYIIVLILFLILFSQVYDFKI